MLFIIYNIVCILYYVLFVIYNIIIYYIIIYYIIIYYIVCIYVYIISYYNIIYHILYIISYVLCLIYYILYICYILYIECYILGIKYKCGNSFPMLSTTAPTAHPGGSIICHIRTFLLFPNNHFWHQTNGIFIQYCKCQK